MIIATVISVNTPIFLLAPKKIFFSAVWVATFNAQCIRRHWIRIFAARQGIPAALEMINTIIFMLVV
jgi:hypothetical protein